LNGFTEKKESRDAAIVPGLRREFKCQNSLRNLELYGATVKKRVQRHFGADDDVEGLALKAGLQRWVVWA